VQQFRWYFEGNPWGYGEWKTSGISGQGSGIGERRDWQKTKLKRSLRWFVTSAKGSLRWLRFGAKGSLRWLQFFEGLTFQATQSGELAAQKVPFLSEGLSVIAQKRAK
jgi:hypothetical protein